jgi:hypothetical protein
MKTRSIKKEKKDYGEVVRVKEESREPLVMMVMLLHYI